MIITYSLYPNSFIINIAFLPHWRYIPKIKIIILKKYLVSNINYFLIINEKIYIEQQFPCQKRVLALALSYNRY